MIKYNIFSAYLLLLRPSSCGWIALALAGLVLAGCNQKKPIPANETYPVHGEVKVLGAPLPKSAVMEFRPVAEDKIFLYAASSLIDSSGKFELKVPFTDRVLEGAILGPHTARITFPISASASYPTGLIEIPEKFTVEPHENQFIITVPAQ
jgi:hypothetical protein